MRFLFLTDSAGLEISPKEKRIYFLFAGFMISFFLPGMPVVNNIFFGLIFLYSFLFNSLKEKAWLLKRRPAILGMLLFYVLQGISVLYSSDRKEGLEWLVIRLPMLMFPIALGTIRISQVLKHRLMVLWVMVVLLAAIACTIFSIIRAVNLGDSAWLYNDSLTSAAIEWQSSYFAILLTVTLFIFVYLIHVGIWPLSRPITLIIGAFLLIFHFLLASRISIILLYTSILAYALYSMAVKKKFMLGLYILGGFLVGALVLVMIFPKTINRFRELGYRHYEYSHQGVESHYNMEVKPDQWNGANIRLAVWQCGWELVQKRPLMGSGLGDKMAELIEVYKKNDFKRGYETRLNLHNSYLDVMVATGFIGLIVFVFAWIILPIVSSIQSRDWLGICVIVAIAIGAITETYIDRSRGNYMWGFLVPFIISYRKQDQ